MLRQLFFVTLGLLCLSVEAQKGTRKKSGGGRRKSVPTTRTPCAKCTEDMSVPAKAVFKGAKKTSKGYLESSQGVCACAELCASKAYYVVTVKDGRSKCTCYDGVLKKISSSSKDYVGGTTVETSAILAAVSKKAKLTESAKCPATTPSPTSDDPCMDVTVTGTMGGPGFAGNLAGTGTLVTVGSRGDNCRGDYKFQFDTGRGTTLRLSKVNVWPMDLDAVFLTHTHSDNTEDIGILVYARWQFGSRTPKIDIVCPEDAPDPIEGDPDRVLSCAKLIENMDAGYFASGEVGTRNIGSSRVARRPRDKVNLMTHAITEEPLLVWNSADESVKVYAIRSHHIAGHVSYRLETPAGSVVIAGDASNDNEDASTREYSTSDNVEKLLKHNGGTDVLVQSAVHPVFRPSVSGFSAKYYDRQSNAVDIGAMGMRTGVKNIMLSNLIPPIGIPRFGPWLVPGGPVSAKDWVDAMELGGYEGKSHVGPDLTKCRIVKGAEE